MGLMDMDAFKSQIEMRSKLDSAMTDAAYAKLAASVTAPGAAPRVVKDDLELADGAARACLRHMGVEPGDVPEGLADAEERLDWLCRPTGTMRRGACLDGEWYKDATGALLGKLDTGEPVALLPRVLGGYAFTDPATGAHVRVNKATADRVQPEATCFYKPLPARWEHTTFWPLWFLSSRSVTTCSCSPPRSWQCWWGSFPPGLIRWSSRWWCRAAKRRSSLPSQHCSWVCPSPPLSSAPAATS